MFTIKFRGWFIHGYFDRPEVSFQPPAGQGYTIRHAKTLLGAKRAITKLERPNR